MKKIIFITALLLIPKLMHSQTFSYGFILGGEYYTSYSDGGTTFNSANGSISLRVVPGIYGEYNFTENMGLKTEVIFSSRKYTVFQVPGTFKFKVVEISPLFKYDFGTEYRKGFYMIIGPNISITKVDYEGEDVDDIKKVTFGAQIGFGTRMLKYVDLEFRVLDYGLSPFYKNEATKNDDFFIGAGIYVAVDLERIINRKTAADTAKL